MKKTLFLSVFCLLLICSLASAKEWSVLDYGAVGDGKTDCTSAFQKALNEAGQAGGGTVKVPTGHFAVKGNLSVPAGVTLQGTHKLPPVGSNDPKTLMGSALLAYAGRGSEKGEPFIRLKGSASAVIGFVISYPEWKQTDVPPVPYPPCIMSEGTDNVAVIDCNILNAYEAIHFNYAGRHLIRNVYGYPIKRGIYVDNCYDIGRIENVHFWPFGVLYKYDDPYCKWINVNGVAFEFNRTDWQYVSNTFCFGYGVGYLFSEKENGGCNGNFLGLGADSCRRAVMVEQAQDPGLLITNGEFVGRWGSTDSVCLEITDKVRGKVSLNNCSFWGPIDKCVWMRSPNSQFTASACNFLNWDNTKIGSPAIKIDEGRAIIQGTTFAEGENHIVIGSKVKSAIIMGNQADGGLMVSNAAGKKTIILANQEPPVAWTKEAKLNYRLAIGSANDGKYTKKWYGQEIGPEWSATATKRWSAPESQLVLPVVPGKAYDVKMQVFVPEFAYEPGAGVYLGSKRILSFDKAGKVTATGKIPAGKADTVTLKIKCKNWTPKDKIPGNADERSLGIAGVSVTMKAQGTKSTKVFNANNGEWE